MYGLDTWSLSHVGSTLDRVCYDVFMRWVRTTKADPAAVAIANRHYSRLKYGKVGKMVGPPGRLLTYRIGDSAVWVSHWPYAELALDKMDSWRCTMFRNEGVGRSSDLIVEAMALTAETWGDLPVDGWVTWIDTDEVASPNPGYCFKRAGWKLDRDWRSSDRKRPNLIRLRYEKEN